MSEIDIREKIKSIYENYGLDTDDMYDDEIGRLYNYYCRIIFYS